MHVEASLILASSHGYRSCCVSDPCLLHSVPKRWAMGSLWDSLLGAGCDDNAKLLLDLSKRLDDDPEFHGFPGCSGPFDKINPQTTVTDQTCSQLPIPFPIHTLACPCSPAAEAGARDGV